jgi:ABC-type dipeptide/oligopeptide/nickel transport system permease subunit
VLAALGVLALFMLAAIFADRLAPYDPIRVFRDASLEPPSSRFPLGTDAIGRDLLSRIIHGARVSLVTGVVAVGIALSLGTGLGLIAGYARGWPELVIMRAADVLLAFPGILLAIAIVAVLGPGLTNVMIAVGIAAVPVYVRTVQAATLAVAQLDYVLAARSVGLPAERIVLRHVLPNVTAPIIVLASVGMGTAILASAGLSYVGLGAQPPTPEWGAMLAEARSYMREAWWLPTFPGIAIMLVVLAFNLSGDAVRDRLDPRLRRL